MDNSIRYISIVRGTRVIAISVIAVCALALTLGFGCRPRQSAVPKPPPAPDEGPYDFTKEGKIPSLEETRVPAQVDRVDTFEDIPVSDEAVAVENVVIEYEPVTPDTSEGAAATADGFRIQVFASGSAEKAESVRQAVEIRLQEPAYVAIDAGVFRVRVGDCTTRQQAEAVLKKCRDAGYSDAWIATTKVNLPKPKTP